MRAAIFNAPGDITVETIADPVPHDPTDAVVRVVLACVCGSDLWFWRGIGPHGHDGVGHEAIGIVEATGSAVSSVREFASVIGDVDPNVLQVEPELDEELVGDRRTGLERHRRTSRRDRGGPGMPIISGRAGDGQWDVPMPMHPRPTAETPSPSTSVRVCVTLTPLGWSG